MTIYQGKRIAKYKDWDLEKGDVGWVGEKDMKECISPCRFFLEDVSYWQNQTDPIAPFNSTKKQILEVDINAGGETRRVFIVEDLDVFDLLMEEVVTNANQQDT